jgi:hypothetical protein
MHAQRGGRKGGREELGPLARRGRPPACCVGTHSTQPTAGGARHCEVTTAGTPTRATLAQPHYHACSHAATARPGRHFGLCPHLHSWRTARRARYSSCRKARTRRRVCRYACVADFQESTASLYACFARWYLPQRAAHTRRWRKATVSKR